MKRSCVSSAFVVLLVLSCLLGTTLCYRFPYSDEDDNEDYNGVGYKTKSPDASTDSSPYSSSYRHHGLFDSPTNSRKHNYDDSNHDEYGDDDDSNTDREDNDDSTSEDSKCYYKKYSGYVPKGKTKVDHLKFLGKAHSYKSCADMCCRHGNRCQLGWLFNKKCFAVSCEEGNEEMCQPLPVTSLTHRNFKTVLLKMKLVVGSASNSSSSSSDQILPTSSSIFVAMRTSSSFIGHSVPHTPSPVPPVPTLSTHYKIQKSISVAVDSSNKYLTLPKDHIKIFASTWPNPTEGNPFYYRWEKLFGPEEGNLDGLHTKMVSLTNLVAGKYGLKVIVFDKRGNYGVATVNITVSPKPHINQAPHIVISPSSNMTISVNDKLILDASKTTDDGDTKHLQYQWYLVSKPMEDIHDRQDSWNKQVLSLENLKIGKYVFKLKVTDEEGLMDIANAHVKVQADPDYPPTANAGESILIHLPHNSVVLDGSKSTDDKGIVKYSWKQTKGNQVEMKGIENKQLQVNKLEVGLYQFELTVTDAIGQHSTSTVTVDVQSENNQPPIAVTTGDASVYFPSRHAILNGSLSTDDYKIVSYQWTQVGGPSDIKLTGENKPVLHVEGLHIKDVSPTIYGFNLTVTDYRNLTNTTTVYVRFHKGEDVKPHVDAGLDVTITLPQHMAILNGSLSHDGFGIQSYQWIRSPTSPAAGNVVGESDKTSVLMLSELINGTYNYTLVVTNNNGQTNEDNVTLTVKEDPNRLYLVQIYLDVDIYKFTKQNMDKLSDDLVVKIGELHYSVHIQQVTAHDQHILVEFYVTNRYNELVNASHIYDKITKGGQDFELGDFRVIRVEEGVCQNQCSYHGYCDIRSKRCVCSTFWMENPFTAHLGSRHSNCDWSILYVVLVLVGVVVVVCLCVWLCCCCCMHRRKQSHRRRIKYAILDHNREDGRVRMLPRDGSGYSKNSLMVSETETEEEILFDTSKKNKQEKQSLITPKNNMTVKNNLTADSSRSKNINSSELSTIKLNELNASLITSA